MLLERLFAIDNLGASLIRAENTIACSVKTGQRHETMLAKCQECKQTTEVKPAQEYPAVAVLLDFNNASQDERDAFICKACARRKIGEFSYDPYPTFSGLVKHTNETKQMSRAEYEALPRKFTNVNGQHVGLYKNSDGQHVFGFIEIID